MDKEHLLVEFNAEVEKYATELAKQKNILDRGEQVKVDITIIPAPDVWIIVESENGWWMEPRKRWQIDESKE